MKFFKYFGFVLLLCLLIPSLSYAGFNYGVDTYEKVDDSLIINSLGDQPTPSTFGKLGVNDFIPENLVKNYLALEGYTIANDYNPTVTNPQFSSFYNVKPDEGYVKLTFAGLQGDPRKTQDVWVLEKEYYKYSSQSQNDRINNEVSDRVNADNKLQTNINNEVQTRQDADIVLNNNINSVNNTHTSWNKLQDTEIDNIKSVNNEQDKQLNKLDNRVNDLERTQEIVGGELRLLDTKKWEIKAFADYSTTRNVVDRVGVRVTFKIGKSYEETRIEQLEAKINTLLSINSVDNENNIEVIPTKNGFKINKQF